MKIFRADSEIIRYLRTQVRTSLRGTGSGSQALGLSQNGYEHPDPHVALSLASGHLLCFPRKSECSPPGKFSPLQLQWTFKRTLRITSLFLNTVWLLFFILDSDIWQLLKMTWICYRREASKKPKLAEWMIDEEWSGLKRTSKIIQFQPPATGRVARSAAICLSPTPWVLSSLSSRSHHKEPPLHSPFNKLSAIQPFVPPSAFAFGKRSSQTPIVTGELDRVTFKGCGHSHNNSLPRAARSRSSGAVPARARAPPLPGAVPVTWCQGGCPPAGPASGEPRWWRRELPPRRSRCCPRGAGGRRGAVSAWRRRPAAPRCPGSARVASAVSEAS